MKNKIFIVLLILIALLGLGLRLVDYDKLPPFGETRDEFMYPWAGMSLLQTGIPTSWADFYSYTNKTSVNYWGINFNLVTPWNEKPPLYPLLVGAWTLLNGATQFDQVRLSVIRQVPIFLNFLSIILLGLLTKEILIEIPGIKGLKFRESLSKSEFTGLIASLLYATIPTIVMANRLSLIENLLIPLSLFTLWVLFKYKDKPFMPYLVGLGCGLTLLTKNTGVALPLAVGYIFLIIKQWKNILITAGITLILGAIYPIMAYFYNWNLFLSLMDEYRKAMYLGLPETIVSLFRFPVIGHKEAIFLDGGMLAGWILLLSSPFWLFNNESNSHSHDSSCHSHESGNLNLKNKIPVFTGMTSLSLWIYPYLFVLQMCLVIGGQTWFGWHWFPVYPFLALILAKALIDLYNHPDIFKTVLFFIILAPSSLRFLMLIWEKTNLDWPKILGIILGVILLTWQIPNLKVKKSILIILFLLYIAINIYTVINLKLIYPSLPQPLN